MLDWRHARPRVAPQRLENILSWRRRRARAGVAHPRQHHAPRRRRRTVASSSTSGTGARSFTTVGALLAPAPTAPRVEARRPHRRGEVGNEEKDGEGHAHRRRPGRSPRSSSRRVAQPMIADADERRADRGARSPKRGGEAGERGADGDGGAADHGAHGDGGAADGRADGREGGADRRDGGGERGAGGGDGGGEGVAGGAERAAERAKT